ncbi:MAG: glycosyltransferase family 4 protein [Lachnospiraceae bacterium]|nr:glycosyltransferase family 4 protein [Lachnospiraceae bacterium]
MKMKRVVIITNQPSPYRVDFFYYLQRKYAGDYEFHIVFASDNGKTIRVWSSDIEKLKNIHFLKSKVFSFKKQLDIHEVIITYGIREVLYQISPCVVVCAEYNYTAISAKFWCNTKNIPYISWSDGTRFSERNIGLWQKISRKYIIRKSAAFIASSSKTKENQIYLGADPDRIYLSELTIDVDKYIHCGEKYNPDGGLVFVGSLIKRKGLDLLFEALALIGEREWKLVVIGCGEEEKPLKNLAVELGIDDKVVFRGFIENEELIKAYENSSLFILPTREDCFGLVTLEAMCCGLPVISSKYADGSYDLIEEGVNGYIIDPYDRIGFSEAITNMLSDKEKMAEMGRKGREKSRDFSFINTSVGFVEAIERCLQY